jgi:plastocyanin
MIEVPGEKAEASKESVEIDQKLCRFEPHIRVVPAGGKVVFLNSDEVSHNIHTYATKNDSFNKTVAPGSKEECTLAKGDKVQVKCDIHDWMSAWVYVADTSHFAITKDDGSFEIAGLKPGKYKVETWHERCGKGKGEITIKDDGTSEPLELKMKEKEKK